MSQREEKGCNGYIVGQCPVQGCGRVDGYPWYFRARGDSWSMEVAEDKEIDPELLPEVGYGVSGWLVEEDWGIDFEAGYMEENIAWQLILGTIEKFRANKLPYIQAGFFAPSVDCHPAQNQPQ